MRKNKKNVCLISVLLITSFYGYANPTNNECGVPALAKCPQPIDRTYPNVKDMLKWDQNERLLGFRNDYRAYPGDVFHAVNPKPLERKIQRLDDVTYQLKGMTYNLENYIKRNDVTALMVIKKGNVVFEYYGRGNTPQTLWTSRSVGKSVVSTLVGIALQEGRITSLDDAIEKYNPSVKGTVWEGVTIRQLLQHTSGVEWGENYEKANSDFAKMTECEANPEIYACVQQLVLDPKRQRYAKAGDVWQYNSGGAWLLGDTLEKATGVSIADYLESKIWQPFGMTRDGVWQSYQLGKHNSGAHGFNATLEDWGKFGLFFAENGVLADGKQTLPENWLNESKSWVQAKNSVNASYPEGIYGFEWWNNSVPQNTQNVEPKMGLDSNNTLWALGIFGQIIVVNPKEQLVIVQWSTWPVAHPADDGQPLEASLMFNAINNQLNKILN
ncbi:serine hydrolase [Providencia vermicola]|uniref:serine hydrolase domain-containing protein n=1 Tax=Providencia TaxID=586 RepID=UPI002349ECDC|nr:MULTISPECIES: serine hydrolase [Providencia]ELR5141521.1 serine hydrolase [Providencia stuartii]WER24011.1 serine hydrolase [Providencia stuartii]WER28131.1 serine hydrolase [Providencia stuartii]WER32222.1 serine hydrolase [Providencia stuartii]